MIVVSRSIPYNLSWNKYCVGVSNNCICLLGIFRHLAGFELFLTFFRRSFLEICFDYFDIKLYSTNLPLYFSFKSTKLIKIFKNNYKIKIINY